VNLGLSVGSLLEGMLGMAGLLSFAWSTTTLIALAQLILPRALPQLRVQDDPATSDSDLVAEERQAQRVTLRLVDPAWRLRSP